MAMQKLHVLNTRELKQIVAMLEKQFGFNDKLDYVFLQDENNNLFIANRSVFSVDFKKLNIDSIGLFFGEIKDDGIKLSIEASQMIGKKANKNIVELTDEEEKEWIKGFDLKKDCRENGFVLIKHNNDFLGTGKCQEGKIINYVPKVRRVLACG